MRSPGASRGIRRRYAVVKKKASLSLQQHSKATALSPPLPASTRQHGRFAKNCPSGVNDPSSRYKHWKPRNSWLHPGLPWPTKEWNNRQKTSLTLPPSNSAFQINLIIEFSFPSTHRSVLKKARCETHEGDRFKIICSWLSGKANSQVCISKTFGYQIPPLPFLILENWCNLNPVRIHSYLFFNNNGTYTMLCYYKSSIHTIFILHHPWKVKSIY